jgi:ABC-type phosphate transport system substrate-binding protein
VNGFPWESVFAVLGLTVPVAAALWEFVLAGRKRLGYRVQMDTTAGDAAATPYAGVLQQLRGTDGAPLRDPSFVLLRIENSGWAPIVEDDYLAPAEGPMGIRIRCRGRRVAGMVVTELSRDELRGFFTPGTGNHGFVPGTVPGFGVTDGLIELPKVKLNRRDHYKVLAVLERERGVPGEAFPDPEVVASVVGGVRGGTIKKTEYHPFASRPVIALLVVLALVGAVQSLLTFSRDDDVRAAPLDCARGRLTLSGSTAFAPVLKEAAKQYAKTCPGAHISTSDSDFGGSGPGLRALADAGDRASPADGDGKGLGDRLTFSDGAKPAGYPRLLPRPVALSLFTLVVSEDAGVQDLTLEQIRDIYAGRITNWNEVHGKDVPIHLVSRYPDSGTRTTLERKVLGGKKLPATTTSDCTALERDRPGRCEVGRTDVLLDTVARTPGALGHSEAGNVAGREGVVPVRIDGYPATLDGVEKGAYPYWQTEYAYTYGEPPADSLAAGFLRYLSQQVGQDIIRSHGDRPCAELARPLLCRPSA